MKKTLTETRPGSNVYRSTGNVFEDMELPDAEELQTKFRLIFAINRIIEERGLTQKQAAKILGVSQPKISALQHGRMEGFSVERLMNFAAAVGYDVVIQLRTRKAPNLSGRVVVAVAA